MKKPTKMRIALALGILLIVPFSAFMLGEPTPDFHQRDLTNISPVSISELDSRNSDMGHFKASMDVRLPFSDVRDKAYYGMEVRVQGNPNIDRIRVGVTNNLISRIEIWNGEELIETKELGFMSKMTYGAAQMMQVGFYDQSSTRYPGKSKVAMRFYSGSGFLGDIGTISMDLSRYGDFTGPKSICPFSSAAYDREQGEFTKLKIWKDYNAQD
jgi:hypothetical protein